MGNTSKITTDLDVDDALSQDASFVFDENDRQFIDNQIRGVQRHLVDALIRGRHATYVRLSGSSASVSPGDTVCLASQVNATELVVTKSTTAALANAKAGFGVVIYAGAPGSMILVAFAGALPPLLTGLASGAKGFARINGTTSKLERVVSRAASDYGMGSIDDAGWVQLATYSVDVLAATVLAGDSGDGNYASVTATTGVKYTGNAAVKVYSKFASIGTTDATVTTLTSFTMSDQSLCAFDVVVTAVKQTAADKGGRWKRSVVYRRNGAGPTIVGALESGTDQETDAGFDVTFDVSSNDVRVRVTGLAATNIRWGCELRVQEQVY